MNGQGVNAIRHFKRRLINVDFHFRKQPPIIIRWQSLPDKNRHNHLSYNAGEQAICNACRRMFVINYCRREAKDLLMTASKGLFAPGNLRDSRPHSITLNISPTGFFSLGLISCAGFPTATNAKSEYGSFTPSSLLSSSFATIGPVCQHAP